MLQRIAIIGGSRELCIDEGMRYVHNGVPDGIGGENVDMNAHMINLDALLVCSNDHIYINDHIYTHLHILCKSSWQQTRTQVGRFAEVMWYNSFKLKHHIYDSSMPQDNIRI